MNADELGVRGSIHCQSSLLQEGGCQLLNDVVPYELMRTRLLNASHQTLIHFGYFADYRYVHEVCQESLFVNFLLHYIRNEVSLNLTPVPNINLKDYRLTLIERFANTRLRVFWHGSTPRAQIAFPLAGADDPLTIFHGRRGSTQCSDSGQLGSLRSGCRRAERTH